jgi:hypothetical protein
VQEQRVPDECRDAAAASIEPGVQSGTDDAAVKKVIGVDLSERRDPFVGLAVGGFRYFLNILFYFLTISIAGVRRTTRGATLKSSFGSFSL